MKIKFIFLAAILVINSLQLVAQTSSTDYFGQTPPGDTAKIFAPGIISLANREEHAIAFSPDGNECYLITSNGSYYTKKINNTWTEQVIATFPESQKANTLTFSADGKRLYFSLFNDNYTSSEIWFIERNKEEWGSPQLLPSPINSPSRDEGYSETIDGVAYICSNRSSNNMDIWCIQRMADQSLQIKNLGTNVNSIGEDFHPCVARDGSYLIFASTRKGGYTYQDLYISFNKGNNEWTKAISMNSSGAKVNFAGYYQKDPSLSPDGKYLFFNHHTSSRTRDTIDIYWVSTNVTVGLKKVAFTPKLSIQIPNRSVKTDNLFSYVIPANTFTCEYGADLLKYTATLKNGAALPAWLSFDATTKTLSGTPKQAIIDSIKITATNKDNLSATCTFKIEVSSATGVEKHEAHIIEIFPNPSTGVFNISIGNESTKNAIVEIFDFSGKWVLSKRLERGVVDLTGYQKGIYVAKITLNNLVVTKKISIQ